VVQKQPSPVPLFVAVMSVPGVPSAQVPSGPASIAPDELEDELDVEDVVKGAVELEDAEGIDEDVVLELLEPPAPPGPTELLDTLLGIRLDADVDVDVHVVVNALVDGDAVTLPLVREVVVAFAPLPR
jgi:hypothetical protein